MIRRSTTLLALVVTGALLATGCGDDQADAPASTTTPERTTTTSTGADVTTTAANDAAPVTTPDLSTKVRLVQVATVDQPVELVGRKGTDTLYVAEKAGVVRALTPASDGTLAEGEPTIDIRDDVTTDGLEQGLLGIAFDPDGTHLIVSYSAADDDGASVIARYEMAGDQAVVGSRRELLRLEQPFQNHNGGNVVFGPDGYLYAGFGDGGSQGDPGDNGQDPSTLLATIIRIDPSAPDRDRGYRIPDDNPFVGDGDARPEVWLYGVRNPWRFSFDRTTGDLWIADVGGNAYEEVSLLRATDGGGAGKNLGWSLREGRHDTDRDGDRPSGMVEPVHEYDHDSGSSITGGFVYRGSAMPGLAGAYLFSDWTQPTLRAVVADGDQLVGSTDLATSGDELTQVSSFGEDNDGELYALSLEGGVFKLTPG